MGLSTIGSIANHIVESINVPTGISGNMIEIVDMNRQHVENYVGQAIGSNSIQDKFQPPIVNFSKADTIDFIQAQSDGDKISLSELSIDNSGNAMSASAWRLLAEGQLKSIGRKANFARSLS